MKTGSQPSHLWKEKNQGWEFTHSLIAHLLIRSSLIRSFAHLLIAHSLVRSFRSNQMSHCEHFAQIAQDKWATVSKSLRSIRGNEQTWAICLDRSEEMSDVSKSLILLTKKWANEQFAQKNLAKKI